MVDKTFAEIIRLIVIPQDIRERILKELKLVHEKKNGYSKEVKNNIIKQKTRLENRIEEAFTLKLDNAITHDFWKAQNNKLQIEKDKLKIQLEEIDKLDKAFYDKADTLLSFTDNAHDYFLKGNLLQRRM